jgi:N-acetylglucosaminyldiphosphoundecaprenol N-acetyl-beta-D-mannosaminyltransferase
VIADILTANPDFIWVGLGTPKQQEWINRNKHRFAHGVLLAVGFAFDVNAGTKKDAPRLMHKLGLTWLFRLLSEPRRLFVRYAKYNTLFLWHLCRQLIKR